MALARVVNAEQRHKYKQLTRGGISYQWRGRGPAAGRPPTAPRRSRAAPSAQRLTRPPSCQGRRHRDTLPQRANAHGTPLGYCLRDDSPEQQVEGLQGDSAAATFAGRRCRGSAGTLRQASNRGASQKELRFCLEENLTIHNQRRYI